MFKHVLVLHTRFLGFLIVGFARGPRLSWCAMSTPCLCATTSLVPSFTFLQDRAGRDDDISLAARPLSFVLSSCLDIMCEGRSGAHESKLNHEELLASSKEGVLRILS